MSPCGKPFAFAALLCSLASLSPRAARGVTSPATVSDRVNHDGYRLSITAHEHFAVRRDFSRSVFLFQQPVSEVRAHELGFELGLELHLLLGLWLEADLPFSYQHAAVHYAPTLISQDEIAPATWHEVSGAGLGEPTLALRYHSPEVLGIRGALAFGARIPGDDNPGGAFLPERLPLSTGQSEWFLEAGISSAFEALSLALEYHLGYRPGDAAAYLVRHVGPNQIASGVLGDSFVHEVGLRARLLPEARFSFELAPRLRVEQNPPLVEYGRELGYDADARLIELDLEARFSARVVGQHRLELFFEHPLLGAWKKDPFFPIRVPERGFGVAWKVAGP